MYIPLPLLYIHLYIYLYHLYLYIYFTRTRARIFHWYVHKYEHVWQLLLNEHDDDDLCLNYWYNYQVLHYRYRVSGARSFSTKSWKWGLEVCCWWCGWWWCHLWWWWCHLLSKAVVAVCRNGFRRCSGDGGVQRRGTGDRNSLGTTRQVAVWQCRCGALPVPGWPGRCWLDRPRWRRLCRWCATQSTLAGVWLCRLYATCLGPHFQPSAPNACRTRRPGYSMSTFQITCIMKLFLVGLWLLLFIRLTILLHWWYVLIFKLSKNKIQITVMLTLIVQHFKGTTLAKFKKNVKNVFLWKK